ncbi:MAG: D-alanyl-D-alanine carboxypeptidase, partial [Patescibacteria group bacterium]|nr:D-alanyl-D-alanine carboxypeptidase [Patescibacteria group bacterium]
MLCHFFARTKIGEKCNQKNIIFFVIVNFLCLVVFVFFHVKNTLFFDKQKSLFVLKDFHDNIKTSQSFSDLPNLKKSNFPVKKFGFDIPQFTAFSIFAMDISSGMVLFEKNSEIQVLPASTTKIMTALVAMESYDIDQIIIIPKIKTKGQKMGLIAGEKISVRDLIYGLLVFSANDAAEVLAYYYPLDGRNGFIKRMNEKAKEVGMVNTSFKNPTGLDEPGHLSTAKDMVILSVHAMKNDFFASVVKTKNITIRSLDGMY